MATPERKDLMAREIARAAGKFITLHSNKQSLITVTHADISPDFAQATIYVSVFPESQEKIALQFLKRSRGEFRRWITETMKFKCVPTFDFALDFGEKNRQAMQDL